LKEGGGLLIVIVDRCVCVCRLSITLGLAGSALSSNEREKKCTFGGRLAGRAKRGVRPERRLRAFEQTQPCPPTPSSRRRRTVCPSSTTRTSACPPSTVPRRWQRRKSTSWSNTRWRTLLTSLPMPSLMCASALRARCALACPHALCGPQRAEHTEGSQQPGAGPPPPHRRPPPPQPLARRWSTRMGPARSRAQSLQACTGCSTRCSRATSSTSMTSKQRSGAPTGAQRSRCAFRSFWS
jgi:hypothetical protein